MEKTNRRKGNDSLKKLSIFILFLLSCCELDGKPLKYIVQSYNINNNSLCSIIDSLEIMNPGAVSRFFKANELKKVIYFREIGIGVGATNPSPVLTKSASFTWNLMRTPIIRSK